MKLKLLIFLSLAIFLAIVRVRGNEVPGDSGQDDLMAENEVDIDGDSDESEDKKLGVASIKVRHFSEDPDLCSQLSRYHPHHPLCHSYCKRQGHWVGQCKKERCHCFNF